MADKTINELDGLVPANLDGADKLIVWDAETGTTKKVEVSSVADNTRDSVQGYYGILSDYYDPDQTTPVVAQPLLADTWTKLEMNPFRIEDHAPTAAKNLANGTTKGDGNGLYDVTDGRFCIAGSDEGSTGMVRILIRIDPEEDESDLSFRLNFTTNATTFATGFESFQTERLALNMTQGADLFYADEALLTFFVGDDLFGAGWDDAGSFTLEASCTSDAEIEVNALTYFIQN